MNPQRSNKAKFRDMSRAQRTRTQIVAEFKQAELARDAAPKGSDRKWSLTQRMAELQRELGATGIDAAVAASGEEDDGEK
jgi:hypothetical protein